MNINRKIQFMSAAVVANGALALGLLNAGPALAASCQQSYFGCAVAGWQCVSVQTFCKTVARNKGCTLVSSMCVQNPFVCQFGELFCFMK